MCGPQFVLAVIVIVALSASATATSFDASLRASSHPTSSILSFLATNVNYGACNTTDPYSNNETISLTPLEGYGNVSWNESSSSSLFISFCRAANITINDAVCGEAFLATINSSCQSSTLYDTVVSSLHVVDNESSQVVLGSTVSVGYTAVVHFLCNPSYASLVVVNVTHSTNDQTSIYLAAASLCAGYDGKGDSYDDGMLSKGAIVGIIIGIVAFVVITSALIQWRARNAASGSDQYEAL